MFAVLALVAVLNQPVPAAPAADDAVECRNLPVTGSRTTQRICMTRSDWTELKAQTDDHRVRNRPVIDNRRMGRGIGRW